MGHVALLRASASSSLCASADVVRGTKANVVN